MLHPPDVIYKIERAATWQSALAAGQYAGSADDDRDGFIHFSSADQLAATAAKHFAGRDDLVLAAVFTAPLGAALRWEASRGGALFPHLYGPLNISAVAWTQPLPLGRDGRHTFPAELAS